MSTYALPRRISEQLEGALTGCPYKTEVMSLATFLGRFWSLPTKLQMAFHVDRRALAGRADLGLSEKRVRRALETLVALGFLMRQPDKGSAYRMTDEGLRRKPALYRFGAAWWSIFAKACRKAAGVVKDAVSRVAGHQAPLLQPTAPHGQKMGGPKRIADLETPVHMGPAAKPSGFPALAFNPDPKLEAALARLEEGFRRSRGG